MPWTLLRAFWREVWNAWGLRASGISFWDLLRAPYLLIRVSSKPLWIYRTIVTFVFI